MGGGRKFGEESIIILGKGETLNRWRRGVDASTVHDCDVRGRKGKKGRNLRCASLMEENGLTCDTRDGEFFSQIDWGAKSVLHKKEVLEEPN